MLQHVVLFRFPEQLGEAGFVEMRAQLESFAKDAAFIKGMRFGRARQPDWADGYEYLLYVELTAPAALPDYLQHPKHVAFGQWIQERDCSVIVIDYPLDAETVIQQ